MSAVSVLRGVAEGAALTNSLSRALPVSRHVQGASSLLQRRCGCGGPAGFSGKCESCEMESRLGALPLQTKLRVSTPGDSYEQEADRIADAVVALPPMARAQEAQRQALSRSALHRVPSALQRQADADQGEEEEDALQAKALPGSEPGATVDDQDDEALQRRALAPAHSPAETQDSFRRRLDGERASGSPLDRGVRADMEQRFGVDLSAVRIHTGAAAAGLAREVHAQAFTLGHHVYFSAGAYQPASRDGRHLLAHELVHTLQQARTAPAPWHGDSATTGSGMHGPAQVGEPATESPHFSTRAFSAPSFSATRLSAHDISAGDVSAPHVSAGDISAPHVSAPDFSTPDASAPADVLQRSVVEDSFVPPRLPDGTLVHAEMLREYGAANPDLFTEVKIPGGKASGVADTAGRADFYMDVDTGGRSRGAADATTIGVLMLDDGPRFLEAHIDRALMGRHKGTKPMLLKGGQKFDHIGRSAPRAARENEQEIDGKKNIRIARIDKAPKKILFGDLKPPPSLTNFLEATMQIGHYKTGLANTASAVNAFARDNPGAVDPPGATWHPEVATLSTLTTPRGREVDASSPRKESLRLYSGRKEDAAIPDLQGHLATYKGTEDGTWNYEWIPDDIPGQLKKAGKSQAFKSALTRIDTLVQQVKSPPPTPTGQKKALRSSQPAPIDERDEIIQRKPSFDAKTWPGEFKVWQQTQAQPLLGSEAIGVVDLPGKGQAPASETLDLRIASGLNELKARVPAKQHTKALKEADAVPAKTFTEFKRMRLWARWGGVFGRLRAAFGTLYVKIAGLFDKAKAKFEDLRKSTTEEAPTSGGSIAAAIAKGAFKVAATFLKVIMQRAFRAFTLSMKNAAPVLIEDLIGEERINKLTEEKKDIEAVVAEAESAVDKHVDDIKAVAAPLEEIFDKIRKIKDWAGDVASLVSKVRWGLRIINCVTPPGVGCLKLILQAVVEELAAKVIASCWFISNFIKPLMSKADLFKTMPKTIAQFLTAQVKKIASLLPFSQEALDKAFKEPDIGSAVPASALDCDAKVLTKAQIEMNKLLDKYGRKKLEAVVNLLEAAGLSKEGEMTEKDVEVVGKLLDKLDKGELTLEQLAQATANLKAGKGSGVTDVDTFVAQLSGLQGSGGGGQAAKRNVRTRTFEEARTGPAGQGTVSRTQVRVHNDKDGVKPGDSVTVTIGGYVDGDLVSLVTGVPATVVEVGVVEKDGSRYRWARYRPDQTVLFSHDVPGVQRFVAGPKNALRGELFFVEKIAPAAAGATP